MVTSREINTIIRNNMFHPRRALERVYNICLEHDRMDEIFFQQIYRWLYKNIKPNTTIVDIGANIGDSSVYFAQFKEVKRVVAYEPAQWAYEKMLENIKRLSELGHSSMADKITPRNVAIGEKRGSIRINENIKNAVGLNLERQRGSSGKMVKVITLQDALKGLKNVAIKCDCEGSEQYIFDGVDQSQVYALIVETHGHEMYMGALNALLKGGFNVIKDKNYRLKGTRGGCIYAKRNRN